MHSSENVRNLTAEEVQAIVHKYVESWNANGDTSPMWVVLAAPGDSLSIPGVTFGSREEPRAGMELPLQAHLIALNQNMRPESLLSTFFHEVGHARYRVSHAATFDHVESEVEAIVHSLESLAAENLDWLAFQEVQAVIQMGSAEPYLSAIQQLAAHPLWRKYTEPPSGLKGSGST